MRDVKVTRSTRTLALDRVNVFIVNNVQRQRDPVRTDSATDTAEVGAVPWLAAH
jgi:hypothetical protein